MADLARGGKKRDYYSKPLDMSGRMIDDSGDKQMLRNIDPSSYIQEAPQE